MHHLKGAAWAMLASLVAVSLATRVAFLQKITGLPPAP